MKRFPLLLPLVAVVIASCTDSTSPASSKALLTPNNPDLSVRGNPPPPPVDAAMTVCIDGAGCTALTGTYFSNGTTVESAAAAAAVGDLSLTFDGTAWLNIDNHQPLGAATSTANARFKRQDAKLSGTGTFVFFGTLVVKVTEVTEFIPLDCFEAGEPCAIITFNATVNGEEGHTGHVEAFDREFCTVDTGEGGGTFLDCEGGVS